MAAARTSPRLPRRDRAVRRHTDELHRPHRATARLTPLAARRDRTIDAAGSHQTARGARAGHVIRLHHAREPRGITPEDTVVFVLGCVPFVYAGIEFWTRIANGDSFGTGKDSVVIKPLGQQYEGNKRVLGQDAMIAARILFAIAGASAVLVVVGVFDVLGTASS